MKKILLALFCLSFLALTANDTVKQYVENPSTENFKKACEPLEKSEDFNDLSLLSNLYLNQAKVVLAKIEKQENLNSRQLFSLANSYLALGELEKCIPIYKKITTESPNWSCPLRHLGEAYYKNGDFEEAIVVIKKSIEARKSHYDAYLWLAKCHERLRDYKNALQAFEDALKVKGTDIEDPEEEFSSADALKLKIRIYKGLKHKDYDSLVKKYESKYGKL